MAKLIERTVWSGTADNIYTTHRDLIKNFLIDITTQTAIPCVGWNFDGVDTFTKKSNLQEDIITYIDGFSTDTCYNNTTHFYLSFDYNYITDFIIQSTQSDNKPEFYIQLQSYKVEIDSNIATVLASTSAITRQRISWIDSNTNTGCKYNILKNNELLMLNITSVSYVAAVGVLYCYHDSIYKTYSGQNGNAPQTLNLLWRNSASYSNMAEADTYSTSYNSYFYKMGELDSLVFKNRSPFLYSVLYQNQVQTIKGKKIVGTSDNIVVTTLNTVYDTTQMTPNTVVQIDEKTFYILDYYSMIDISENA